MHKIIVKDICGCFKKSDFGNNIEITSKDEALSTAIKMKNHMNQEFCKKHDFQLLEHANDFVIAYRQEAPSSCCGSGCCS